MRVGWLVVALGLPVLCAATPRPDAQLEFHGDATEKSCPSESEFRDRVVARLGFDPFVPSAKQTVVVRFRDDGAKVRAEVALRSPTGTSLGKRELSSPKKQCSELGESAAMAVSLLLDPLGTASSSSSPAPAPAPSPSPSASPAPPPPPPPPAATTPPPAPPTSPPVRFTAWLTAQSSLGRGPGPTAGVRLGLGVRRDSWSLGLEGSLDSTFGFVDTNGTHVRALFATAGGVLCHAWGWLEGCGLASIGVAQGEAEGLASTRKTLVGFAGLRAGVPLCFGEHACFVPTLDVLGALVRTRQVVSGEAVWTAAPLSLSLGAEFRLF